MDGVASVVRVGPRVGPVGHAPVGQQVQDTLVGVALGAQENEMLQRVG